MNKRSLWAVAISVLGGLPLLGLACAGGPQATPATWCCDLSNGSWSCTAGCEEADRCPSNVSYQERCVPGGTGGPTCTEWSCTDAGAGADADVDADVDVFGEAGPPPPPPPPADAASEAGALDAAPDSSSPETGLDAPAADSGLDAPVYRSFEAGPDAARLADASAPDAGPCTPSQPCDGLTSCTVACYGADCCQLACSCENAYGGAGAPDDPSARLVCTATCP